MNDIDFYLENEEEYGSMNEEYELNGVVNRLISHINIRKARVNIPFYSIAKVSPIENRNIEAKIVWKGDFWLEEGKSYTFIGTKKYNPNQKDPNELHCYTAIEITPDNPDEPKEGSLSNLFD